MKRTLLATILIFLMAMNGVLLYLVVFKPGKKAGPPHDYIVNELNLTEDQTEEFRFLEREHRLKMRTMDGQLHDLRHILFSNTQNREFPVSERDSLLEIMGWLSQEKDLEVFSHFKRIGEICTPEQQKKLEVIMFEALQRGPGRKGPPRGRPGRPLREP